DYRHLMGFVALLIVLLCSCRAPDAPTEMAMGNAPPAEVMAAAAIAQGDLPDAARPHDASRVRDFAGVTAQHDPAVLPASDQSPAEDDAPAAAPVSDGQSGAHPVATASYHAVGLPPEAFTGRPGDGYTVPGKVPAHMREVMGLPAPEMHTPEMLGTGPMPQSGAFCTDGQCPPHMAYGDQLPRPIGGCGPWKPPGIAGPWPADEYIFDGGDQD